jgi:hypothetical protein
VREAEPVVVLGIDPGTAVTGYGVVRKDGHNGLTLIECGVIRTKPSDALPQRLSDIHDGVVELIRRHNPAVLSIEDIFYARNVRTTVVLGHARGVILLAGSQAGTPNVPEPPTPGVPEPPTVLLLATALILGSVARGTPALLRGLVPTCLMIEES